MQHIQWENIPFTEAQLRKAWTGKTYVAQVQEELNSPLPQQQIKNLGKMLGLPALKNWTPSYSPSELTQAWANSLTAKEAAQKLGTPNTKTFRARAIEIGLQEKPDLKNPTFTKQEFEVIWEEAGSLDEAARHLGLPANQKSFNQLKAIAKAYNLPTKGRELVVTATGEDASTIIGAWIDWHQTQYEVQPTRTEIAQAGKKIKELILAKYSTDAIKWGIFQWTLALHTSQYRPSPDRIQQAALAFERAKNPHTSRNITQGIQASQQISRAITGSRIEERRW